ncbi:MAG: glycosyltransferase [Patescibacteria group bacterium]|nr:glycosyltransferase [Patescibacteria group bacterium]
MVEKRPLRVGFDLDGVLLYNPARILRPIIFFFKKYLLKSDVDKFYFPKTKLEKLFWQFFHKTSLFPQAGIEEIKALAKEKKIKAYIVSSRYRFLERDFWSWVRKIDKERLFSGYFFNKKNEQPDIYKSKVIKRLNLDFFVEDNFDIVKKLKKNYPKLKVFWITNLLDCRINYTYKFSSLKEVVSYINDIVGKKTILIVSDYYYPHWTGISKSIYNLSQVIKKDFNIKILTVRFKKNLKKIDEGPKGVVIIRKNYLFSFSRVKYSISLIFTFISILKRSDIVFLNSPLSNILPLSLVAKFFKKKLIIFHQGDLKLTKGLFNIVIEKIFDISTLVSFFFADKVSTYTKDYAQHSRVMKYFLNKFQPLIPPVSMVKSQSQHSDIYRKLKSLKDSGKILFGFGGRFVEEKGFDILLKAIPEANKYLKNAHFVFGGKTKIGYEKTFEILKPEISRLKRWLTFLGHLNDQELVDFYQMIDFFIVPSRSDCFNLMQMEAMINGKPCLVADIPGARYLVKKTKFGLLFNKEDYLDLAIKINKIFNQKEKIVKNYLLFLKFIKKKTDDRKIKKFFTE